MRGGVEIGVDRLEFHELGSLGGTSAERLPIDPMEFLVPVTGAIGAASSGVVYVSASHHACPCRLPKKSSRRVGSAVVLPTEGELQRGGPGAPCEIFRGGSPRDPVGGTNAMAFLRNSRSHIGGGRRGGRVPPPSQGGLTDRMKPRGCHSVGDPKDSRSSCCHP